jgi:hypothetical protein
VDAHAVKLTLPPEPSSTQRAAPVFDVSHFFPASQFGPAVPHLQAAAAAVPPSVSVHSVLLKHRSALAFEATEATQALFASHIGPCRFTVAAQMHFLFAKFKVPPTWFVHTSLTLHLSGLLVPPATKQKLSASHVGPFEPQIHEAVFFLMPSV